jgi:hypothetical protein
MKRLLVSFIGETDLKYLPPNGENVSPILRLLTGLQGLQPTQTRLLLFDDDRNGRTDRRGFCEKLQKALPELGLTGLDVTRRPISLPAGPTDLNALYETVWAAIPKSGPARADEVVFHFSSGTPAMKVTLLLAANCLRLDKVRVIETSSQHGVLEIRLPYVLAAREIRERERTRLRPRLDDNARKTLLPDTVIDDPLVNAAYAALYKAAVSRGMPPRVLVRGPEGSGKWHACKQFANWRAKETVHWLEASEPPKMPQDGTVLIYHLDAWSAEALKNLTLMAAGRPDIAIAATFRTDHSPIAPLGVLAAEGLRGAAHIELPALGARPSDIVALSEALARQMKIADGRLKDRLQYDFLTDTYRRNLHDLKNLLATAAMDSPGIHPERPAYVRAKQIRDAEVLLNDAWRILAGLDFRPGQHPTLAEVLETVRVAVALRAKAQGRTLQETGELLGLKEQTVSDILRRRKWKDTEDEDT